MWRGSNHRRGIALLAYSYEHLGCVLPGVPICMQSLASFLKRGFVPSQIAFSSVATALRYYVSDLEAGRFHVHHGVIEKAKGSAPNDPGTFVLKDHFAIPTNVPTPAKSAL